MALQSSGPMRWSTLSVAFGNASNAQFKLSDVRASTQGVGTSNIGLSNWQNACIPWNGYCMNRFLSNMSTQLNDAASANTIFNNSNGSITYVNTITVPNLDSNGNEWTGWFRIQSDGTQSFQIGTDDGGEFTLNTTVIATHYGQHASSPAGAVGTSNISGGVYPFKFRQQELVFGQDALIAYTPPGFTTSNPSAATTADFMSRVTYLYKPIVKFDANDLAYRQGLSINSTISTWSNNGTDGTLRHATGLSANSSTLATLQSNANGFFVSFDRAKQQYFQLGNLEFNQFQSTDASPLTIKGITIFAVASLPTTAPAGIWWERIFDFGNGAGDNNIMLSRFDVTSSINVDIYRTTATGISRYYPNAFDGNFHLYTVVSVNGNPPTCDLYMDGVLKTDFTNRQTPAGPYANRTLTLNYIGKSNWADAYLNGSIREILIFREAMDKSIVNRMNAYLMYKWGITNNSTQLPPVTIGLVGYYTGESWTGTQWSDRSGSANHVTTVSGTVTTSTLNGYTTLTGTAATALTWPTAILPSSYTLFHVAKYNGATRQRIFQATDMNFISGFHGSKSGVAYHNNWITDQVDRHGTAWVLSTDQNNIYRSQGVDRTIAAGGTPSYGRLAVNTGNIPSETSDWAIAAVAVYNRTLTLAEIRQVEYFLNTRYAVY